MKYQHNSRIPSLTAFLFLVVVAGLVGLSACGSGGPSTPGATTTLAGIRAPDIVITPPGNRAPGAGGSIPDQTLTVGGNTVSMDVALYFRDPDNYPLRYSAVSDRPGIVRASMSGGKMTLTPVSAGTTTVMVTASDDHAAATQIIAATVLKGSQAPEIEPMRETEPETEPETELTGVVFAVQFSKPQETVLSVSPEPAGARLSSLGFDHVPGTSAGRMSYLDNIRGRIYFSFRCQEGFYGNVTITLSVRRSTINESVSVTCR